MVHFLKSIDSARSVIPAIRYLVRFPVNNTNAEITTVKEVIDEEMKFIYLIMITKIMS